MTPISSGRLRLATAEDGAQLLGLWALLFDDDDPASAQPWTGHAREWFARCSGDALNARFPVIEVDGELVATAIGTLEIGVPPPMRPRPHRALGERHHPPMTTT